MATSGGSLLRLRFILGGNDGGFWRRQSMNGADMIQGEACELVVVSYAREEMARECNIVIVDERSKKGAKGHEASDDDKRRWSYEAADSGKIVAPF
jgi:hypothetical protein